LLFRLSFFSIWLIGQIPNLPGTDKEKKSDAYRKQKRNLFHAALAEILKPILDHALTYAIFRNIINVLCRPFPVACSDGVARQICTPLALYIADFPEQCAVIGKMSSTQGVMACVQCKVTRVFTCMQLFRHNKDHYVSSKVAQNLQLFNPFLTTFLCFAEVFV
jgi:hypothetical protein